VALRLMIYDRTDRGPGGLPGLSSLWGLGSALYRGLGRLDAAQGVSSWGEALDWIIGFRPEEELAEIQLWSHGKWGSVKIDSMHLDARALAPGHEHHHRLCAIRERMTEDGRWWFRTCETFGADAGHDFARRWTDFFGRAAAGHTYVIAYWQSGLHSLAPGEPPSWPATEGIEDGTAAAPEKAFWSRLGEPHTISCLRASIPEGW
jgi:hypothetical protein